MTDDPNSGAARAQRPGASRTGRVPDASSALFAALQSRPGHAVVVADDAAIAETFFERVDAQLVCQRRVRLAGDGVDAEAVIHALAVDIRGPHRPRSGEAILSMVATEARAAGLPILVIITAAEQAVAASLERLATLIEAVPDARAAVRLVLLGGPRLEELLAQPEARKLAARVVTTVRAPSRGAGRWTFPWPSPRWGASWRDTAQWIAGGLVALAGVVVLLAPWGGRDGEEPTTMHVVANEAVETPPEPPVASEPPAPPEPESGPSVASERSAAPEPSAPPEPSALPEPSAVPEPPSTPSPPPAPESAGGPEPPPVEGPRANVERPKPARPTRAPSFGQSLQVGAFRSPENARALAATLSARFPDVSVVTVPRAPGVLHCVRLGGFADEGALAARADALRAAGYAPIRVN